MHAARPPPAQLVGRASSTLCVRRRGGQGHVARVAGRRATVSCVNNHYFQASGAPNAFANRTLSSRGSSSRPRNQGDQPCLPAHHHPAPRCSPSPTPTATSYTPWSHVRVPRSYPSGRAAAHGRSSELALHGMPAALGGHFAPAVPACNVYSRAAACGATAAALPACNAPAGRTTAARVVGASCACHLTATSLALDGPARVWHGATARDEGGQ